MPITFEPIGVVRSPFHRQEGTPVQPAYAAGARGALELHPSYAPALRDLDGFERIWILYAFDRAGPYRPVVVPYLDHAQRGLFATRAPSRPNPIGISVLKLISVAGSRVEVEGVDVLDGTPLLDLKPYVPEFDAFSPSRAGWLDRRARDAAPADARFAKD